MRLSTPQPQCDGVNRRGVRCRRKATPSLLSQQASIAVSGRFCKIHLRMALSSRAAPRVRPPGFLQLLGGSSLLVESRCIRIISI